MNQKFTFFLLVFSSIALMSYAQPTAFTTCPNGNVAIVRTGSGGATTNPFSIYDINTTTGAASLVSGPIKDPNDTTINLQINGLGLNLADGFLYGLFSDAPATLSTVPTTPYYRLGANSKALQLGTLTGPPFATGDNGSFVIPNAGEFNQSGTYYFSAVTGFVNINIFNLPASTFTPSNFYIGALTGSNLMTAGTASLSPTYVTISNPSNDAAAYLASSFITITATNAQGLGLQDLVYNNADGNLYTYVSYPNATNTAYFGQMLKVNPTTGVLSAVAAPAIQTFLSASVIPNGMLVDASGNFLVVLSNGDIYKANGTASAFTGSLSLLNTAPGLPATLTGDMASCGMISIPLPHNPFDLQLIKKSNIVDVQWVNPQEDNIDYYEIQYGSTNSDFKSIGFVQATSKSYYSFEHENNFAQAVSYYRIKMVDHDANVTYSFVRSIKSITEDIRIFPNPVKDNLSINFSKAWVGEEVDVELINAIGQKVYHKTINNTTYTEYVDFSMQALPKGIYFVRLSTLENERVLRIVKD